MLRFACIWLLLACTSQYPMLASLPDKGGNTELGDLRWDNVTLTHIDADSAELEITVSGTASKTLTAETIYFENVTANDLPIHVLPVHGPIRFQKGKPLEGIPQLSAWVSFREVVSLSPLRQMIDTSKVHIHATLMIRLDLNPLQMLVLRAQKVWVRRDLDEDVPLNIAGGQLGRVAALGALMVAEPVWVLGNRGREWREAHAIFRDTADDIAGNSLVEIETSFDLRSGQSAVQHVDTHSIGFAVPGNRIVTVNEAVEPWLYSPALAEAVAKHEASLVDGSIEIAVRPGTQTGESGPRLSLRQGQIRIVRQSAHVERVTESGVQGLYRLALRDSPDNVILIETSGFPWTVEAIKTDARADPDDWRTAAVFHFDDSSRVLVSLTEAKLQDGRYITRDANPDAVGSPIVLESGAVGLLQDETSAVSMATVLKRFSLESF